MVRTLPPAEAYMRSANNASISESQATFTTPAETGGKQTSTHAQSVPTEVRVLLRVSRPNRHATLLNCRQKAEASGLLPYSEAKLGSQHQSI